MNKLVREFSSTKTVGSSIHELSKLISSKSLSPVDLVEDTLERIDALDEELHAYITVTRDSARKEAKKAEMDIRDGKYLGPLHGIPVSLKDLIYVSGVRSTSGSRILSDFTPDYDATVVKRLKEAGAIIVGTNNTHEFACGITNINPHYGSSKNPWDPSRMSGGSSGGSAVAVSAGMAVGSLGTDTSGSIRVPSSLCGLFGLKPTYGRVSKYGVMPLAPSIDHVGPIARTAWDTAALLQAIAGFDILDESTLDLPVPDYLQIVSETLDKPRKFSLGVPQQYFFDLIDSRVMEVFENCLNEMHGCGVSTVPVTLNETHKISDAWKAFRLGESAAVHSSWLKSRRNEYGSDVLTMLERGTKITAVEYITALRYKKELKDAFLRAMKGLDGLLVPTTAISAPLLEETSIDINGKNTEVYVALSRLTTVFDITGLPALNVPAGLVDGSLPIGVQLVGREFDEALLLSLANEYERYSKISEAMIAPCLSDRNV
jgi:aspartyl-tRNA(Asn)/glutamyl-tRNA(Gln) amidotransferase subunit A